MYLSQSILCQTNFSTVVSILKQFVAFVVDVYAVGLTDFTTGFYGCVKWLAYHSVHESCKTRRVHALC